MRPGQEETRSHQDGHTMRSGKSMPAPTRGRQGTAGPLLGVLAAMIASCDPAPHVIIETDGEAVTSESGTSVAVKVSLARAPQHRVIVRAVSSDTSEGRVSEEVSFDRRNWNQPQTITVTGVDDAERDGDVCYEVRFGLLAGSKRHEGVELGEEEVVSFINRDDDLAAFTALGDLPGGETASYVSDISADGEVVVGSSGSAAGMEAARWTSLKLLQGLGGAPSSATGVSPNGRLIVGAVTPSGGMQRAGAIWLEDKGPELLRGGPIVYPEAPPLFTIPEPHVVLDDGRVYGSCIQTGAYGDRLACRYDGPEKLTTMGVGAIFAADAAGTVAGTHYGSRYEPIVSVATLNGVPLGYPPRTPCSVPHSCASEVRDFSTNAAIAVGTSRIPMATDDPFAPKEPLFDVAFHYTQAEGMRRLEDLAGGVDGSAAYAISADGKLIAGYGTDDEGQHAVVWMQGEPARLSDLLEARGARVPEGWSLLEVRAMSADGKTFAGNAINPQGKPEGFRASLFESL